MKLIDKAEKNKCMINKWCPGRWIRYSIAKPIAYKAERI